MMRHIGRWLIPILLLAITVGLSYRKVLDGFFQQDEWLSFARHIIVQQEGGIALLVDAFLPSVGHYQPLNTITIHTLFLLFGLRYTAYAVTSIILHLVNVALVFLFAKKIFKSTILASLTALLFGTTASIYQATSWVLADIGIHFATMFAILSLLFFFEFLIKNTSRNFILSMVFLFISLLYKEITIGFFVLLPVMYFLFGQKAKREKRYPATIITLGLMYVLFRVLMIFIPQAYSKDVLITQSQPLEYLIYNLVTFPLKAVAQVVIPVTVMLDIGHSIADFLPQELAGEKGTTARDKFVEGTLIESISLLLFFIIGALSLRAWYQNKNSPLVKYSIFGLLVILLNSAIYALAPERSGKLFVIDSRHLYFVAIGSAILIILLVWHLSIKNIFKFALVSVVILINIYLLNQQITTITLIGSLREDILQHIYTTYPVLPKRVVFYTESDTSLYGLPSEERILPFQSGFGQTLLMWYYPTEQFPAEFFKNRFLWEITDQGYKEMQNWGFGYFRDFGLLTKTLKDYTLSQDAVLSLRYDSNLQEVSDNTKEVRGRISGFFSHKKQTPLVSLTSSHNVKDLHFITDGIRETSWSSQVPYAQPQFIELELPTPTKVVQITIDSYNNKDQNQVGYRVLLSEERENWKEVFYSKRYPPAEDQDGLVNLYFSPQKAVYIKIEQKGYHEYAPWVIHELRLYETID